MYSEDTLALFVQESNRLEGEPHTPGSWWFDDHLATLKHVVFCSSARQGWVCPTRMHGMLMRRIEPALAGKLRWDDDCWIGNRQMPPVRVVSAYLTDWECAYEQALNEGSVSRATDNAFVLYAWLMCIHPFMDGNGRTGRLLHAQYCVRHGIPLHIFYDHERDEHMKNIRTYESTVFAEYRRTNHVS